MSTFFNEYVHSKCSRLKLLNGHLRDLTLASSFNSCTKIIIYLEEEHNLLQNEPYRKAFNSNKLRIIYAFAKSACSTCNCSDTTSIQSILIMENIFRALRNACVQSTQNQWCIVNFRDLLDVLCCFINDSFKLSLSDDELRFMRVAVQCLGNLSAGRDSPKLIIWKKLTADNALNLPVWLEHIDIKIRQYSSMLFFNCLNKETRKDFLLDNAKCLPLIKLTLNNFKNDQIDWSLFTLQYLLQDDVFMNVIYSDLDSLDKQVVLDILLEGLCEYKNDYKFEISLETVNFLIKHFSVTVQRILQSQIDHNEGKTDPIEILKILESLCYTSLLPEFSNIVKSDITLLELSLVLLKSVHTLGKEGLKEFKPVQDLKSLIEPEEDIVKSPFYSLKCNLIRLIASMCDENEKNQNFVREASGIELILDCCNLDAKNPFIIQWSVLAIRNLMKNNLNNQQCLANLSLKGPFTKSPLLNELGIVVE